MKIIKFIGCGFYMQTIQQCCYNSNENNLSAVQQLGEAQNNFYADIIPTVFHVDEPNSSDLTTLATTVNHSEKSNCLYVKVRSLFVALLYTINF